MTNYAALREALSAGPTEGPWSTQDANGKRWIEAPAGDGDAICEVIRRRRPLSSQSATEFHANAQLIAAANPITIHTLLDELDSLREDAERYRWLCGKFGVTKLPCSIERILDGGYIADGKDSIDAAIDIARKDDQ